MLMALVKGLASARILSCGPLDSMQFKAFNLF
jgi:hypothetical protein